MDRPRAVIRFVNAAYATDHMFMLIFPVAVFGVAGSFGLDYAGLIGLSLGGFIAFGVCSLPAGRLGDTRSRRRIMLLFFSGIGAAVLLTGLVGNVLMLVTGLTLIGVFAAIYHPVDIAMLVAHTENRDCEIDINGMWGNLGVALAALFIGFLTVHFGWCAAFILPGGMAILLGIGLFFCVYEEPLPHLSAEAAARGEDSEGLSMRRASDVLALVTTTDRIVSNASTVIYSKLFQERLNDLLALPQILGVVVSLIYIFGVMA